jgi:hypothetical protein
MSVGPEGVGSDDIRRPAEVLLLVAALFNLDSATVAGVPEAGPADLACWALIVELDEEVDDSRTGSSALRVTSLVRVPVMLETGRGRSGLLAVYFASLAADNTTLLEYDDAELGVGT